MQVTFWFRFKDDVVIRIGDMARTGLVINLIGAVIITAIVYTYGSWKGGDPVFLTGSLIFLVACISFMIPMIVNRRSYLE